MTIHGAELHGSFQIATSRFAEQHGSFSMINAEVSLVFRIPMYDNSEITYTATSQGGLPRDWLSDNGYTSEKGFLSVKSAEDGRIYRTALEFVSAYGRSTVQEFLDQERSASISEILSESGVTT